MLVVTGFKGGGGGESLNEKASYLYRTEMHEMVDAALICRNKS